MSVVLEGMADGGVMVGIPRATSQRIAAHTMMVRRPKLLINILHSKVHDYIMLQSAASLVLQKGIHPAQVGIYHCIYLAEKFSEEFTS